MASRQSGRVRFGPHEYDFGAELLLKYGTRLKLEPKPRAILRELLRRPGELVGREELRSILWPEGTYVDFDLGLNVAVKKLRDALCDSPDTPRYIETAAGQGYRFIAPVELVAEPTIAPLVAPPVMQNAAENATAATAPEAPPAPARHRGWLVTAFALAALVLASFLLFRNPPGAGGGAPPLAVHQVTWNAVDTPVLDAAISPDGKFIAAFDRTRLAIQEVGTAKSHILNTPNPGGAMRLSWLPDSAGLIVCGRNGIWSLSLLGGSQMLHGPLHPPAGPGCAAAVSPDGAHVAFLDADGMWIMGAHGEQAHRVVGKTQNDRLGGPSWSPDSSRFAYSLHRQTQQGIVASIETRDVDGGSPSSLPFQSTGIGGSPFPWLPDGRMIFSRPELVPYGFFSNLWVVQVDPRTGHQLGDARQLTDWPDFAVRYFSASAEQSRLLFLRHIAVGTILAGDIAPDGTPANALREVTNDEARNRPIAWSSDGRALYVLSGRGRATSFYRLDVTTRATTPIEAPNIENAQLVRGGTELTFGIENPRLYSIYRRSISGGPAELVLTTAVELDYNCASEASTCVIADQAGDRLRISTFDVMTGIRQDIAMLPLASSPVWSLSPDGARIALTHTNNDSPSAIEIRDVATGKRLHNIELPAGEPLVDVVWAGSDALIATREADSGGCDIVRIDLHGRERLLWHDRRWLGVLRVSRDGSHFAASALQDKVNAWLGEHF